MRLRVVVATVVSMRLAAAALGADPLDWPNWRGPEQNRISRETGLIDTWNPETGENVLWKNGEAAGISAPIVMNGKVYMQVRHKPDTKEEQEKVLCLDANTGEKLWENCWNVYLSDVPAERVGWPSVAGDPETGRVYALGVNGYFSCIDGETGKTIWSRSLGEEFGMISPYGGRTHTPAIFEDLVIVNGVVVGWGELGRPAHRIIAMDKNTGEARWYTGTKPFPEDTIYSTPFFTVLDGQAAMVIGSADGSVWAFQPRTGKPIWNFKMSRRGLNVSPVVVGDKVYISQAEENLDNITMGSLTCINGLGEGDITKTNEVWRLPKVMAGKSSPLVVDGRVYSADDSGNLYIAEAETGKMVGKKPVKLIGTIVRASPLFADGKIYLCSTTAWHVLEPTAEGVKFVNRMRLSADDEVSGSMAVSHGKIYLPTGSGLYCLGKKDGTASAGEIPAAPVEKEMTAFDIKPAWVQVVPCDALLTSGQKQQFTVAVYNSRGQHVGDSPAEFTLSGPGEIDQSGVFTAPPGQAHTVTTVTAKYPGSELTGEAHVRVVPPLPWKFDFNDIPLDAPAGKGPAAPGAAKEGEAPVTWVGARHRHKIRERDGEKMMVKVTTIPKGTRSQCWMGQPDLHDYTVQADLCGQKRNLTAGSPSAAQDTKGDELPQAEGALTGMPNMGVIAQRYTLDMMGNSQQLQIRSWPPQVARRFSKTIPFSWQADKWYTMKFSASTEGNKAVLRGKVWPRGEKEPAEWTIEAVDDTPNLQGSPGLFGMATNAEIYIDNVIVTPNQPASQAAIR